MIGENDGAKIYPFPERGKIHREKLRAIMEKCEARIAETEEALNESVSLQERTLAVLRSLREKLSGEVVSMDRARESLAQIREVRGMADADDVSIQKLRKMLADMEEDINVLKEEDFEITDRGL